ncbi:MAG: glycosyltransferase [Candidatus Binatia bacterium]|nr:glycosyltransferase [Candidatus Binatia bacterium]
MDTIRICIGTERRTIVAQKVLEYSILANVAPGAQVEFDRLEGGDWAGSGPEQQYTGFSFLRWTIPERVGWRGKAIYLDADMLCLGDVSKLWAADETWPSDGACVWCTSYRRQRRVRWLPFLKRSDPTPETSVMLIDCGKAKGRLLSLEEIELRMVGDEDLARYREVMHLSYLDPPPVEIPQWWNLMDGWGRRTDGFEDERAQLLHFTDVPKQPWYFPDHPKRHVWEEYLEAALAAGYVTPAEIADACDRFTMEAGRPDGMHAYWRKYAG